VVELTDAARSRPQCNRTRLGHTWAAIEGISASPEHVEIILLEEWEEMAPQVIRNLIESRYASLVCRSFAEFRGGHTYYY
jgi:hypothetical protein